MTRQFSIGDKVITLNKGYTSNISYGTKGKIIEFSGTNKKGTPLYMIDFAEGSIRSFSENFIELSKKTISEHKFKVGDKVRSITGWSGVIVGFDNSFSGNLYTLIECDKDCNIEGWSRGDSIVDFPVAYVSIYYDKYQWISENECELIQTETKREFQVGDSIKMKQSCSGCKKGEVYTLHEGSANGEFKNNLFAWNKDMKEIERNGCNCNDSWELVESVKEEYGGVYIKDFASCILGNYKTGLAGIDYKEEDIEDLSAPDLFKKGLSEFKEAIK